MKQVEKNFTAMIAGSLNLSEPWYVEGAEFRPEEQEVHIYVNIRKTAALVCPCCGGPTLRNGYAIAAEQPQRDNPLKHVEDTIEQNDNNFDGLINNTPQTPTVADFEQRAKAGEAISVTDLAKAVKAEKREQPQKKPSILKKLDEYKKQAAQQPKDKQKEHKKDLEV